MIAMIDAKKARGRQPVVVDVGANHGIFSFVAALHNATVVAIEPQPDLAKFVAMAAVLNGQDDRIMVLHHAVAKLKGTASGGSSARLLTSDL